VDDGIIAGKPKWVEETLARLSEKWKLKILDGHRYAGWQIYRNHATKEISVNQKEYLMSIKEEFAPMPGRKYRTPMEQGFDARVNEKDVEMSENAPYMKLIGSLLYASQTRPDIAYAVNVLSRHMADPKNKHWMAAKRVLWYLLNTADMVQVFGYKHQIRLVAYADASFAEYEGRSRTGGLVYYRGSLVHWQSNLQNLATTSTAEAEYVALNEIARSVLFVRNLLGMTEEPTEIFEDNEAAIKIAGSTKVTHRSKHIGIRYHATRDYVRRNLIKITYLQTSKMIADSLTKQLPIAQFEKYRDQMGMQTWDNTHRMSGGSVDVDAEMAV
jgi:hypothetical protein